MTDAYVAKEFGSGTDKLLYRFFEPSPLEKGKAYPLLIFLHGAGERGGDNKAQLKHGCGEFIKAERQKKNPCFVIAPQCPTGKKWVEVEWSAKEHSQPKAPSSPLGLLIQVLEQTCQKFPIDKSRIYLTGLSMGGFGTWDWITRQPDLFAAAAPICGGGDEKLAGKVKDLPIWAFHGAKDTVVVPARTQGMIEAIRKAGGKPKYTEYPEAAHDSWTATYANEEFYTWLFSQKKS